MNYTFNLGKVHVPTPMGQIEIEDIRVDVQNVELKEVLMLMKELPAFTKAMKEATEEEAPSAGSPFGDILGEILKAKSQQSSQQGFPFFGQGFPFGDGVEVEETEHPLFGKGFGIKVDPSKLGGSGIAGDISSFLKGFDKKE